MRQQAASIECTIRGVPPEVDRKLRRKGAPGCPGSSLGEIKAGFYGAAEPGRNQALLPMLLARPILLPGRETAERYARLYSKLRRAGALLPDNDLGIAALALEHDLVLIGGDKHFRRIPQLLLEG